MRKGYISFIWSKYTYIVAYLCFQGEPSGFEKKNSFQKELRKNRGQTEPRENKWKQTEGRTTMHKEARPCCRPRKVAWPAAQPCWWPCMGARLPVLGRTVVLLCTSGSAPLHDRAPCGFSWYNVGFRCILGTPSVGVSKSSSIRVFRTLPQTPLGRNKLGVKLD